MHGVSAEIPLAFRPTTLLYLVWPPAEGISEQTKTAGSRQTLCATMSDNSDAGTQRAGNPGSMCTSM